MIFFATELGRCGPKERGAMSMEKLAAFEVDGDMYGITFDLDTNMLERDFGLTLAKAYGESSTCC